MSLDATKLLIKPTYGIDNYGEDLSIPLTSLQNGNVQEITFSTATFDQYLHAGTRINVDPLNQIISDVDTGVIINAGNDTQFDYTYDFLTDMTAFIYKTEIWFAMGLNVSAYTSGNFNLDSVRIILTEYNHGGDKVRELGDFTRTSNFSNPLTGTGTQIFLGHFHYGETFKVKQGNFIRMQIISGETSGVGTFQVGIIPLCPFIPNAIAKTFVQTIANFHIHASLDHMYPIFRSQDAQNMLDYSGISINGLTNGVTPI